VKWTVESGVSVIYKLQDCNESDKRRAKKPTFLEKVFRVFMGF